MAAAASSFSMLVRSRVEGMARAGSATKVRVGIPVRDLRRARNGFSLL